MKTSLFSILATLCTLPVCAQVSIGVIGGYSHATQRVSDRVVSSNAFNGLKTIAVPKWHAGLITDIHLVKGLYVQPQILLSAKGVKEEKPQPNSDRFEYTAQTKLLYLEIPVDLLYKFPLGPGKLAAGIGAYYAFGLSGEYKDYGRVTDPTGTPIQTFANFSKIRFESSIPPTIIGYYYKNTDAGMNFIAGYEFKMGIIVNINYSLGLTDVYPRSPENRKNSYFGVSAGYLLKPGRR